MSPEFQIPAGSRIQIGVPARRFPDKTLQEMVTTLRLIPGILEAHLPMLHVIGSTAEPCQVLVVVLEQRVDMNAVVLAIAERLRTVVAIDHHLDIWPMRSGDPLLNVVRNANCPLFPITAHNPWWRFWR